MDYIVKPLKRIDQIYRHVEGIGYVNKLYYPFANMIGFLYTRASVLLNYILKSTPSPPE